MDRADSFEKSTPTANQSLLNDAISDPAVFSSVINSKFSRIDTDGSNTLSIGEIDQYAKSATEPKEKAALSELSNHFETYRDLATPGHGGHLNSFFAAKEGTYFYGRTFGGDTESNAISRKDLSTFSFLTSSEQNISNQLTGLRSSERTQGALAIGTGVVIGGLGTALLVVAPGPVKIAGGLMAALGVAVIGHGVSELRNSQVPTFQEMIDNRRNTLSGYGFKMP